MDINLRGPLYCCHTCCPPWSSAGEAGLSNVSSSAGFAAPWPMLSSSAVSKAALYRLTETSLPRPS